ncbi:pentapeptide repeat-containing protein [uncultured Sulfitobacter sp.]|uniref:pentapeptide repeat-containing protein n=1 Tax=uncultured Sulfitobacter sp. TaxID=191468 RepID=UPI0030D6EB52
MTREFARHGGGEYGGTALDDIIFEIDGRDLLGIVLVLAFLFVPVGFSFMPYKGDPAKPPFERLQRRMGLGNVNSGLLFVAITLWTIILGSLVLGLLWEVWSIIASTASQDIAEIWKWRFSLAKIAALTATLGGVVALPFTLIRLTFTRTQTEIAVEALFNDKINAAVEDLHARSQISVPVAGGGKSQFETLWEDDVIRRNGAIDRLEGLAQEDMNSTRRIERMLLLYFRELSTKLPASNPPSSEDKQAIENWLLALKPARSDLQSAIQTVSRIRGRVERNVTLDILDLSRTNLQGFDLSGLSYRGAKLHLADLRGARLLGTDLRNSSILGTEMEGTDLYLAKLQGTAFTVTNFGSETVLSNANLKGASVRQIDFSNVAISNEQLQDMFGDASVVLPDGHGPDHENWPNHWSKEKLDLPDFKTQWRAFQARIGQDPDNPE